MAHLSHAPAPPVAERFNPKDAGLLPMALLGAGVIGVILSLIGLIVPGWREQFAFSWLFASTYFFTLCAGSLFWVLVHHATDAEWSVLVRRQLENTASLIGAFILFFVVLLLFVPGKIWLWWDLKPGMDALFDAKSGFLNHSFFYIRFILYFVLLGGLALFLRWHSMAQDRDGRSSHSHWMRKTAVGGLVVFALSLTFAAIDFLMGLDYKWFSTMWGVYIFAGSAGAAMSLLVLVVTALRSRGYLQPVTMEHYHIMGKWMLVFTIFWAYIGFDQYMLTWYANIPEETSYFRIRNTESWHFFSTFLVVGRFFLPFPILLTQWIKKHPNRLCLVAGWVLLMQLIDIYVVVLPALHKTGFSPSVFDVTSFVGVGGLVGWLWFWMLGRSPLFPTRDPRLEGSIKLTN